MSQDNMRDTLVPRSERVQEPPFVSPIIVLVTPSVPQSAARQLAKKLEPE